MKKKILIPALALVVLYSCKNTPEPDSHNEATGNTTPAADTNYRRSPEIVAASEAIDKDPASAEGYYLRGKVFNKQGMTDSSISDFEKAVSVDPGNALYRLSLADAYYMKLRMHDAENEYKKAIELKADYDEAYFQLGTFYYTMRNYPEAITTLDQLLKLNPNNAEAKYIKGRCFLEKNDTLRAVTLFEETVRIDNDHFNAYSMLAKIYINRMDNRAIAYMENALRIRPDAGDIYANLALFYQQKNDIKKAIAVYEKYNQAVPGNNIGFFNLGKIYFDRQDFQNAIEYFSKAIINDQRDFEAYNMRGLAKELNGDILGALSDYEFALSLNPDFQAAQESFNRIDRKRIKPNVKKKQQ